MRGNILVTLTNMKLTCTFNVKRQQRALWWGSSKNFLFKGNFFNHPRNSPFEFKCFPEYLRLLIANNANSHSVLLRKVAAYKQVFNTWGCQNSGFLSPISDNPDKILTMLRQVLMEQTILTNEASRSANLGRIINYKIWNFIFYPSTLNLIVNKKQKE